MAEARVLKRVGRGRGGKREGNRMYRARKEKKDIKEISKARAGYGRKGNCERMN